MVGKLVSGGEIVEGDDDVRFGEAKCDSCFTVSRLQPVVESIELMKTEDDFDVF